MIDIRIKSFNPNITFDNFGIETIHDNLTTYFVNELLANTKDGAELLIDEKDLIKHAIKHVDINIIIEEEIISLKINYKYKEYVIDIDTKITNEDINIFKSLNKDDKVPLDLLIMITIAKMKHVNGLGFGRYVKSLNKL